MKQMTGGGAIEKHLNALVCGLGFGGVGGLLDPLDSSPQLRSFGPVTFVRSAA